MSSYQNIIDDINSSELDFHLDSKYNEVIEYYKMTVIHIIISTEATMYKICSTNNLLENLKKETIYDHISIFTQKLLLEISQKTVQSDIDSYVLKLGQLTQNDQNIIFDKVFFIIYNFYQNFNRNKIPIKDYEKFKKYIVKKIVIFIKNNVQELMEVLKDDNYTWEGEYSLDSLDFYYDDQEED